MQRYRSDSLVSKVWVVAKADFEFFYRNSKDFSDNNLSAADNWNGFSSAVVIEL